MSDPNNDHHLVVRAPGCCQCKRYAGPGSDQGAAYCLRCGQFLAPGQIQEMEARRQAVER